MRYMVLDTPDRERALAFRGTVYGSRCSPSIIHDTIVIETINRRASGCANLAIVLPYGGDVNHARGQLDSNTEGNYVPMPHHDRRGAVGAKLFPLRAHHPEASVSQAHSIGVVDP
jgi:hypothetical protein